MESFLTPRKAAAQAPNSPSTSYWRFGGGAQGNQGVTPSKNITGIVAFGTPTSFTPSAAKSGLAVVADKENGNPNLSPDYALGKRKKYEPLPGMAELKAKKQKALAFDDADGAEEIIRLQEELNQQKKRVHYLQQQNTQLEGRLLANAQEREELLDAREKLGKELKDQQCAKEVMLLELATKTKQTVLLEQERDTHQRDLAEQGQRLKQMQEEYEETKREVEMQKKRMDLLDVALKENNMQLAAHAQQEKKLQEECDQVREHEQQTAARLQQTLEANERLQRKMQAESAMYQKMLTDMETQLAHLKKEYFFSSALAIKLNLSLAKTEFTNTQPISALYDEACLAGVGIEDWSQFVLGKLLNVSS